MSWRVSEPREDVIRHCLMKSPLVVSVEVGRQEGVKGEAGRPVRRPPQLSRGKMREPGLGGSCEKREEGGRWERSQRQNQQLLLMDPNVGRAKERRQK